MTNREVLDKIKGKDIKKLRGLPYDYLKKLYKALNTDERIEFSEIIGYPVLTRMLMNELQHDFVLLQDGAAAIIVNDRGEILLQSRADRDKWGLPGGCQELGERFEDTIIREIKEETNLDVLESDLKLIDIVSGASRMNSYPNGDVVINNTAFYLVDNYSGELKWNEESKTMKFFDLDNLPSNQHDPDLIDCYKRVCLPGYNELGKVLLTILVLVVDNFIHLSEISVELITSTYNISDSDALKIIEYLEKFGIVSSINGFYSFLITMRAWPVKRSELLKRYGMNEDFIQQCNLEYMKNDLEFKNQKEREDDLYSRVLEYVLTKESVSRKEVMMKFKISKDDAHRIIKKLEHRDIVSRSDKNGNREVLVNQNNNNFN